MKHYCYYLIGCLLIGLIITNGATAGSISDVEDEWDDNELYDNYDEEYDDAVLSDYETEADDEHVNDATIIFEEASLLVTPAPKAGSFNSTTGPTSTYPSYNKVPTPEEMHGGTSGDISPQNVSSDTGSAKNQPSTNFKDTVATPQPTVNPTDAQILGAGFGASVSVKRREGKVLQSGNLEGLAIPSDCSDYQMLPQQPAVLPVVQIPKCCAINENYYFDDEQKGCAPQGATFDFNLIQAVFYDQCIEDRETQILYKIVEKPACQGGLVYNEIYGDLLYILSNGSLLRVGDEWDYYDIFDDYCIDMMYDEGNFTLSAISCRDKDLPVVQVSKLQGYICAVCMFVSVPFLIVVAIIYFAVPTLNDLHGQSLAMHSLCLATGYLLLGFIQFTDNYDEMWSGYLIQYAILACFFWLLVMVVDISMQVWRYLPKGIDLSDTKERIRICAYAAISQITPLIFVGLTYLNGYHGIPSYYFRSTDAGDLDSQKFFIPVVSCILVIAIILSFINELGFKKLGQIHTLSFMKKLKPKLDRLHSHVSTGQESFGIPELDDSRIKKFQIMRISTNLLLGVMFFTWLCEIFSFYFSSAHLSPILFLDIINALQGVFIFMLFVCLPRPFCLIKTYIKEAYDGKGSVDLTKKDAESAAAAETQRFLPKADDVTIVKDNGADCKKPRPLQTFGNHVPPSSPQAQRKNLSPITEVQDNNNESRGRDEVNNEVLRIRIQNPRQSLADGKTASITSEQSFVFKEQPETPAVGSDSLHEHGKI